MVVLADLTQLGLSAQSLPQVTLGTLGTARKAMT